MTFPYPWCTALFQCAASVPFILLMDLLPRRAKPTRSANPLDVFVLSTLFMLCSSSSLQGLRHEVLPIVIVGKSLAPISCILLEHIVLQTPLTTPSLAALFVGALGGALCALHSPSVGPALATNASRGDTGGGVGAEHAIFVAVMSSALMACMSVCEKRTIMVKDQSTLGLCLYRNALAAPLLALPVLAGIERPEAVWVTLADADAFTWFLLLLSACSSAFAGLLIFELQRHVSATTTQVANLCYTLVTAVLGGAVFHSAHGGRDYWSFLGFALSAASVCLYAASAMATSSHKAVAVIESEGKPVEVADTVPTSSKREDEVPVAGKTAGSSSSSFGIKGVALVVLTFQNSSAPLLMRQSRSASAVAWISQTGVIMQEVVKGCMSLILIVANGESLSAVVESRQELLRACIPALLYLLQNNLQYVAVTYLDAATYTVTYQLKILSTALMSVLILKRRLDLEKWAGLVVLVAGVALVQIAATPEKTQTVSGEQDVSRQILGLAAVLMACLLSGLAGVYTEKILKGSTVSLWVRNAQLALCSLVIGSIGLLMSGDFSRVLSDGFFVGYTPWTVASIVNNSFGGLLIAVVIKYADNILKNFSTAISIIFTTFISANYMGLQAGWMFIAGVCAVCGSTFLYGGACRCQSVSALRGKIEDATRFVTGGSSSEWGVKGSALIFLSFQNSAAPIMMRKSRSSGAVPWIAQTGVIMQELLKGVTSVVLILANGGSLSSIVESREELMRASVPAFLYLLQNNLQYIAVTYLDAATYTVTYQLKILSTAVLSVLMLQRKLAWRQWAALVVLVIGVAMVQVSGSDALRPNGHDRPDQLQDSSKQVIGLAAVLSATLLSGLAGVYTEKILKGSSVSLWTRNAQLALCSLVIGLGGLIVSGDIWKVQADGFFVGYNAWTVASVVNNSFGGLLIAVVIKYADNILKNFSTSISIILTTILSASFMGLQVNSLFGGGVLLVCYSTFLYAGTFTFSLDRCWLPLAGKGLCCLNKLRPESCSP